jgi:hypothetical protein
MLQVQLQGGGIQQDVRVKLLSPAEGKLICCHCSLITPFVQLRNSRGMVNLLFFASDGLRRRHLGLSAATRGCFRCAARCSPDARKDSADQTSCKITTARVPPGLKGLSSDGGTDRLPSGSMLHGKLDQMLPSPWYWPFATATPGQITSVAPKVPTYTGTDQWLSADPQMFQSFGQTHISGVTVVQQMQPKLFLVGTGAV